MTTTFYTTKISTMKKHIIILFIIIANACAAYAAKQKFSGEYTYHASEADSKITARDNALNELRKQILREIGEYIESVRKSQNGNYSEYIEGITAGIASIKILDEKWDGETYLVKGIIEVDPQEVNKRLDELRNDKAKEKELEQERRRRHDAEAQIERQKREIENLKRKAAQSSNDADKNKYLEQYGLAKSNYQTMVKNYNRESLLSENWASNTAAFMRDKIFFVDYRFSMSAPFGFSFGAVGERWGGYTCMKINVSPSIKDISDNLSLLSSLDYKKSKYNHFAFTAGAMLKMLNWCYLWGGIGYGYYWVGYPVSETYYGVVANKRKGMETELGATVALARYLTLSVGYNLILFGGGDKLFREIHFGVGLRIGKK
jgi:F0F1-type ATP synthase epsilon subunit